MYAELHAKSNFSFLEGASHPEELVERAAELGYAALAVTDRNSLAGVVRAHVAAKEHGLKLIVGAEITPEDGPRVILWPTDRAAYGRLARLITRGRRRAEKGACRLTLDDLAAESDGLIAGVCGTQYTVLSTQYSVHSTQHSVLGTQYSAAKQTDTPLSLDRYREIFPGRCCILAELHHRGNDQERLDQLAGLAQGAGLPLAAAGNVHFHVPQRQPLGDVLTAVRCGCTVATAGELLFPNAQRYLRSPGEMAALFARYPEALRQTLEIAQQTTFSLDELRYEYPKELAPPGQTPMEYLTRLAWEGARNRYPQGVPDKVRGLVEHELQLIEELHYEAYFLTVWDLVVFARSRGILCQGRGSAANSAVCFCLGVTSVDPERMDLLFERFISRERNEAPDINVDFEHERREEVLQYLYEKYGRERAGMTAEVITYRPRSAVRDVGRALGMPAAQIDRLAKRMEHYREEGVHGQNRRQTESGCCVACREAGVDPQSTIGRQLIELVDQLIGFPRHLSQHTGGMVMTRGPLCELVPIENAAMPQRTVIQWNKDDLDELGILKVDCLALGMLTAIRKCFALVKQHYGAAAEKVSGTICQNGPKGAAHKWFPTPFSRHRGADAGQHPRRRRGRLRDDPPGRHDGRVPDREPGPDEHAPPLAAQVLLRPGNRGGHCPPRSDPGQHGPSLSPPPQRRGGGRVPQRGRPPRAGEDAGRAAVPGAGDAAGGRGGRLHSRRGRSASPRHRARGGGRV